MRLECRCEEVPARSHWLWHPDRTQLSRKARPRRFRSRSNRRRSLDAGTQFRMTSQPPAIRRIIGVIPARFASVRFPGKPLALIAGKPLIQHVVEQCQRAKSLSEVIVATDDTRIW